MYGKLNNEVKMLIQNITQMIYFMRGSISYEKALYGMSFVEREIITDYISNRLKEESKSMHPNY